MAAAFQKPGQRLAIYGGTFDPVHHGHLIGARDVLEQFGLDAVIFVPCAESPHKRGRRLADARHRLAMLRAACRGEPRFLVSDCELRRPGPSFAVDTVITLRVEYPLAEWHWIIGADQMQKLPTWHRYRALRRLLTFVVLARPGARGRKRPGVLSLPRPRQVDISATEIRTRVSHRLPIHHLAPLSVANHIRKHGLYRK